MNELSFDKFITSLLYDERHPLLFNSGLFLFLFAGFLAIYNLFENKTNSRLWFLVLFSIYFYYKSSGWYFLLMVGTSVIAHYATIHIYITRNKARKKLLLISTLCLYLSLLVWFKYANFLAEIISTFTSEPLTLGTIFLPLGISFYTFELISYSVDAYKGLFKPVKKLRDFLFYVSFFPHLVAGPIVRPKELLPQIFRKLHITPEDAGRGVFLIISGLVKKAIISDYISSNFVDRIFDNPTLYSGIENLFGVYAYALQIYCDFSGYSDMAMGIALFIGFRLPANFNAPYQSASLTEFWRRWHISLSTWLRDYLYIPLGGNRVSKFKQGINLMITMLLGGLWHGASWKFILWGGIHGLVLVIEKQFFLLVKTPASPLRKILGVILTFHIVTFCWIFFRASSFEVAGQVLHQIAYNFNGNIALKVIFGYAPVFTLIILGYMLHFTPNTLEIKIEQLISHSHLLVKALLITLVIWCVIQTKSANVQPFIYFQF